LKDFPAGVSTSATMHMPFDQARFSQMCRAANGRRLIATARTTVPAQKIMFQQGFRAYITAMPTLRRRRRMSASPWHLV